MGEKIRKKTPKERERNRNDLAGMLLYFVDEITLDRFAPSDFFFFLALLFHRLIQ
jgi:hypothetical protein